MRGTIVTLRRGLAAAVAAGVLLAVSAAPPGAGPRTWKLMDYSQTACFSPHVPPWWPPTRVRDRCAGGLPISRIRGVAR